MNYYQTNLVDPLPCLDEVAGNVYSSAAYSGAPCQRPAFHTTVINVQSAGFNPSSNGLGAAIDVGWAPVAVLTDGTLRTLAATGSVSSTAVSAYFSIDSADIENVASIVVPPAAQLQNKSIQLTIWGYVDASLDGENGGLNQLHNVATAIPERAGTALTPVQASADIVTVPTRVQLGISKSFGATGAGPGGSTLVNIVGAANLPHLPLAHDVVITDLLPLGMTWTNPVPTATFTLNPGGRGAAVQADATIESITDFEGSGRELVRVTIPAAAFTAAGAWTITPPNGFLAVSTPTALGIYPNTDQIFLHGLGTTQLLPACTTPTQTGGGTSSAELELSDPLNLSGDGIVDEQYCQDSADLAITGTGAAFSLTKTVQGDFDPLAKGPLGIGDASKAGSGTYVLNWTNVGTDTLATPVIYDLLPAVGDHGVTQGQAGVDRGSKFATTLTSVGALPEHVSVEYSTALNPCRDEVYPNSANPDCVDDWTETPSDLGDVKALRFSSTGEFTTGAGFAVSFTVSLPAQAVNQVAWNSAATNATDVSDPGTVPLPAEPPKVGITASTTPVITSQTSHSVVEPNTAVTDSVTIVGSGRPGALEWSLVGPVAPIGGACTAVDWSRAAVVDDGVVETTGDGTYQTGSVTLTELGCYSWTDSISSTEEPAAFPTVDAPDGAENEVILVRILPVTVPPTAGGESGLASTGFVLPIGVLFAALAASIAGVFVLSRRGGTAANAARHE